MPEPAGYRLTISQSAEKELAAVPAPFRSRVIERIQALAADPRPMNSQKLSGRAAYRVRSGNYRILYTIDDAAKTVAVSGVRHRSKAYRKF